MTDFNQPTNSSLYTDVLTTLNAKITSVAKMDFTGDTNVPTGAWRLNSTSGLLETWSGSAWTIQGYVLKASATGTAQYTGALQINSSSAPTWDTSFRIWGEAGWGARYDGYQHRWDVGVSRTEAMRINASGFVGIGLSDPIFPLDVRAESGAAIALQLRGRASDQIAVIRFTDSALGEVARMTSGADGLLTSGKNLLIFNTSNTERMRITSTGNVGIGTSSPIRTFQVGTLTSTPTGLEANLGAVVGGSQFGGLGLIGSDWSYVHFGDYGNGGIGKIDYYHGDDSMRITVNNSERVRIISSGSVGIGTTSPAQKLHVDGGRIRISNATFPVLELKDTNDTGITYVYRTGNVFKIENDSSANQLVIDPSGWVMIGTATVNAVGVTFNRNATGVTLTSNTSDSGTFSHAVFTRSGTTVGSIQSDSTTTSYNTSSDYRLKENFQPIIDGIVRIKSYRPLTFNFKQEPDKIVRGFVAHEVQEIYPHAVAGLKDAIEEIGTLKDVSGNTLRVDTPEPQTLEDGQTWEKTGERPVYQGIDQSKLIPDMMAAIQELIAKVEALEAQIAPPQG